MLDTLQRLVDFDRLNDGGIRVSVGAVDVASGNLEYFDNARMRLDARHILASGALPPAFPAVEMDGRWYWDGGLVSNTPLSQLFETEPRRDALVFQVDLWSARGELPQTLLEVHEREKEIRYSSRTRAITDMHRIGHFKDYQFGRIAMHEHWQAGLADIARALAHPEWRELPRGENDFDTHDATA
jgi:NTE family protein